MRIKAGLCDKDCRYANKVIQWLHTDNGGDLYSASLIKDKCTDTHPIILVSINPVHPTEYNYVKIYWTGSEDEATAKCYYVENREYDGNLCYLHLSEDYLYTLKSYLLNLTVNVLRQEFKGSPYIPDDRVICSVKRRIDSYTTSASPFGTSGTGTPVVLTVSGGNS